MVLYSLDLIKVSYIDNWSSFFFNLETWPPGLGTLNAFAFGHKARELARLSSADRKSTFIWSRAK